MLTAALVLTVAALTWRGAFFLPEAVVVPGALVGVAMASRPRIDRRAAAPLVASSALAAWWTVAAVGWGDLEAAAPLLGSLAAFAAALALCARAPREQRDAVQRSLVAAGAVFAAVGLLGYALRDTRFAINGVGPWRLLSTLSYQNAAGTVLAALAALTLTVPGVRPAARRAALSLLLVALIATLSRGALLAAVVAALVVPRRVLAGAGWPALCATAGGLVCLVTAGGEGAQPFVALAVGLATVAAAAGPPRLAHRPTVVVAALVVAAAGGAALTLADPVLRQRTDDEYVDFRIEAWEAAAEQARSAPVIGVGPEEPLVLDDGGRARFAHNEYLQVAAGAGGVGVLLLGLLLGAVAWATTRANARAASAVAALVAVAVSGAVDFAWHLPAVGAITGWAAGLALERREIEPFDDAGTAAAPGEGGPP